MLHSLFNYLPKYQHNQQNTCRYHARQHRYAKPSKLHSSICAIMFYSSVLGSTCLSIQAQAQWSHSTNASKFNNCYQVNGSEVNCTATIGAISNDGINIRHFNFDKIKKTNTISQSKTLKNKNLQDKEKAIVVEKVDIIPVVDYKKMPINEHINEQVLAQKVVEIEQLTQTVEHKQKKLEPLTKQLLKSKPLSKPKRRYRKNSKPLQPQSYNGQDSNSNNGQKDNQPKTIKNQQSQANKEVALTQQLMKASYTNNEQSAVVTRCQGQWIYPNARIDGTNNSTPNASTLDSSTLNTETQGTANTMSDEGIHALADYGYYDNKDKAELVGNVTVKQGNQLIQADKVTLNLTDKTAVADGQVLFTDTVGSKNANHLSEMNPVNSQTIKQTSKQAKINRLKGAGIVGVADKVTYHTDEATANVNDIAFASVSMQAHGYAKQMRKKTDHEYQLQGVTFSTCPPEIVNTEATATASNQQNQASTQTVKRKWQIDASQIDLNTETGRAETYNTTLRIKDVPVLYLPYFNFPIDERRSSGFLLPNASLSTTTGLEVSLPYYFNLAPEYDATLTTRVFTDRNPMLTGEFRYLTDGYGEGQVTGSFLAKDKRYQDKNRSSLYYKHFWQSPTVPHWTADAEFNYVSDSQYNDDFDYLGSVVNDLSLPRHIKSNYFNDYLNAELKVETFQSLDATNNDGSSVKDKDRPYDRLPQLTVKYRLPKLDKLAQLANMDSLASTLSQSTIDNLQLSGEHDTAYFKKRISDGSAVEQSGFRMYNAIDASYPFRRPWGSITPSVKLQHLFSRYDRDAVVANQINEEENHQSVFVPQFNLDVEAHLIKQGTPFPIKKDKLSKEQIGGYQVLSPRIKYSYAPYKKQNDIPNFNTGIASVSYDQLYADSWFLGNDRLQDLHAITPGVNYRYIDKTGLTRLDASIAEQYYLDKGLVTLDDNSGLSQQSNRLFSEGSSGIVTSISAQPYDKLWLDFDGALTSDYDLSYVTSQLRYRPNNDSQFSLGVVERKYDKNTNQQPLSAVTGSAVFPIQDNWRLVSQTQYDYDKNKFLDSLVGIDYEDCCLGFSVYGRHYYNDLQLDDGSNNAVMAELRLKGISNTGRLSKLLSNRIVGIDDINQRWSEQKYNNNSKK